VLKRSQSQRFFRLALFATICSFLLIVLGAWGRISDAALGCPEWPGCAERLFAPQTAQDVNEARSFFPRQTGEEEKMLKDTLHRYFSGALGLFIIRLAWLGWSLKKHVRRQQVLIPILVVLLVYTQVVLGIATIKIVHKPLVTMLNLSIGFSILGLLWWVVLREQRFWRPVNAQSPLPRRLRLRALFGLFLVVSQIALGGWVTANYAALACPDFPLCQGQLWPEMNPLDGFTLWRDVGIDYEGVLLNLAGATAVDMAHRIGAVTTVLYVGWLALYTLNLGFRERLGYYGLLVLGLLAAEMVLGAVTVVTHLPVVLAVAHSAMAALLMMSLITLNHVVRPRP
jgi:cytochrome c oxidase assembly protein subunit 15